MARLIKVLTTFILCLGSVIALAQHKEKQIELQHLAIETQSLSSILDSIVLHEKKCHYYDSKLFFIISIKRYEDKTFLSISSLKDINLLLSFSSGSYGYFYHQNHLFIVKGDRCKDILSNHKEKRIFKYLEYNYPDSLPKKEEKITIYIFNDDSFSQWDYRYVNRKFVLEGKSTFCD